MLEEMTVNGVLINSPPARAKKREDVEAKRGAAEEEAGRREVAREREKEKTKERREAMVLVEVARNGGGGERSEAEMAREGRVAEGLRGKQTESGWSSLGIGLGFLRRSRCEEGEQESRAAMAVTVRGCDLC